MTDEELAKAEKGVKRRWTSAIHYQRLFRQGIGDKNMTNFQTGVALGYVEAAADLIAAQHGSLIAEANVRDWIAEVEEKEKARLVW